MNPSLEGGKKGESPPEVEGRLEAKKPCFRCLGMITVFARSYIMWIHYPKTYSLYPPTSHPFKGRRLLKEIQKAVKKI